MMNDMGGEDDRRPRRRFLADQLLETPLVDRIEAGEGLVEHHQLGLVDDRPEDLDRLRHALRQGLDRLVDIIAEPVLGQQYLGPLAADVERQAAERAHEGDRLLGGHRRIEPALLRQIANHLGRLERTFAAEQGAMALIGLDDSEQHSQRGGLAGAVGAEDSVDASFRNRDVDSAHRLLAVEGLVQALRLDR
jgi:hypothetical protein